MRYCHDRRHLYNNLRARENNLGATPDKEYPELNREKGWGEKAQARDPARQGRTVLTRLMNFPLEPNRRKSGCDARACQAALNSAPELTVPLSTSILARQLRCHAVTQDHEQNAGLLNGKVKAGI